jgi:TetR/AcrR family transcriptional regulator
MILSTQRNQSGSKRIENEALIITAAEKIFADMGYAGATMQQIADAAGLPKANLHYYFPTKEILYRNVIDKIFNLWLEAADIFEAAQGPKDGLSSYIDAKLESSRHFPNGSKVWANEVIQGAPIIQDYLESRLTAWTQSKAEIIEKWIAEGLMDPINPKTLLYFIWSSTQHYADFQHQIRTLNNNSDLTEAQWIEVKEDIKKLVLKGVGIEHCAKCQTVSDD